VWIVYNFTKQLIVTLLQQLTKFREVGWAEAASLNFYCGAAHLLAGGLS